MLTPLGALIVAEFRRKMAAKMLPIIVEQKAHEQKLIHGDPTKQPPRGVINFSAKVKQNGLP